MSYSPYFSILFLVTIVTFFIYSDKGNDLAVIIILVVIRWIGFLQVLFAYNIIKFY